MHKRTKILIYLAIGLLLSVNEFFTAKAPVANNTIADNAPKSSQIVNMPTFEHVAYDSYVDSAFPSQNFGNENSLVVQNYTSTKIIYLHFDFSKKPVNFNSVALFLPLNATSITPYYIKVWSIDSEWNESTITYENRPLFAELLPATVNFSGVASGGYLFNMPCEIGSKENISLAVALSRSIYGSAQFFSQESLNFQGLGAALIWSNPQIFTIVSPGQNSLVNMYDQLVIKWEYLGSPLGFIELELWWSSHNSHEFYEDQKYLEYLGKVNASLGSLTCRNGLLADYDQDKYFFIKIIVKDFPMDNQPLEICSGLFFLIYEYYGYNHNDYLLGPIFVFIFGLIVVVIVCLVRLGSKNKKVKDLETKLGLAPSNTLDPLKNNIPKENPPSAIDSQNEVRANPIRDIVFQLILRHGYQAAFQNIQGRLLKAGIQDPDLLKRASLRQINETLKEYGYFLS